MPRRKPNNLDMVDDIVETAVGALFERGADLFEKLRTQQVDGATAAGQVRAVYACASCRKNYAVNDMQMIDPKDVFGLCRGCFKFVWTAGQEKVAVLAQKAKQTAEAKARAAAASGGGTPHQAPPPPRKAPWEVLGISSDASVEEINKAWRKLAAQYHPDRISGDPNVTDAEREHMRAMFDEITRCRDAMLRVRKAPS